MPSSHPTFTLTIGQLRSTSANPVAGPARLVVDRDMDVPADALRLWLADRAGATVGDQVDLALGDDGAESAVFTGTVAALRPGVAGAELLALGTFGELLNLRTAATYEGQAAGSIARDLAGQAGLSPGTVDDGPVLPHFAVDGRLSAFAHLKGLADRLGYELYTDVQGRLMFHALGGAAGLDAVGGGPLGAVAGGLVTAAGGGGERYLFGQHLLEVTGTREPAAWGTVDVVGESPMSGQGERTSHWLTVNDADYRGSAGSGGPRLILLDPAARTKDLADRFAAGRLAVARRAANQLRVTVLGRPDVDLGADVSAADVPDALAAGSGYVRAVRHRFGAATGFVTDLRVSVEADA
jgi:phage protein D